MCLELEEIRPFQQCLEQGETVGGLPHLEKKKDIILTGLLLSGVGNLCRTCVETVLCVTGV